MWTSFADGRNRRFHKDFVSGSKYLYFIDNTMTYKWKNKDGEVRYFRDGVLIWAVLLSGDNLPQV